MEREIPVLANYTAALMAALAIAFVLDSLAAIVVEYYESDVAIGFIFAAILMMLAFLLHKGYRYAYHLSLIVIVSSLIIQLTRVDIASVTDISAMGWISMICILPFLSRSMFSYFVLGR